MNLDYLNQAYQQNRTEGEKEEKEKNTKNDGNSNLKNKNKTKKIMLVDNEADILWLFKNDIRRI